MKVIKRILAVVLVLVVVLSMSACIHKKDEIAVTVGNVEFKAAYYLCALINADMEAKQKVQENETQAAEEGVNEEIDYFSKKIDGKKYVNWVEDTAIENLGNIAAYKTLCKEKKIKLTTEKKNEAEEMSSYYWTSYGYSALFEPNGVSETTYKDYMLDSYYAEEYFQYVYGEKGTKALKKADVKKEIADNYILVDVLQTNYTEEMSDADKKAAKAKLQDYADAINAGEKTYDEVYREFNNINEEETEDKTENSKDDKKTADPINKYATVMGAEGTNFESEDYATYRKYKVDTPKVVEPEDKSGVKLVIKRSISKDEYYMDSLDTYARHTLADEDFKKEIKEYVNGMETKINKYAISEFDVKDIVYSQS